MKALGFIRPLEVGELQRELRQLELPVPEPNEKQLLVRVRASCVNIDDIHAAEGTFFGGIFPSRASAEEPFVPGVDVAGTVVKAGACVEGFKEGDAVLGFLMPKAGRGSWAEYCCLEARYAVHKPRGYSFEEAAACAIGGKTAANAVLSARLAPGQRGVVVGASGGIGSIIVQILHRMGVQVTGVCSTSNLELVRGLGADQLVDYTRGSFDEQLQGESFDAVIDCVGGRDTEARGLSVLKKTGRFVTLCGPEQYIGEKRTGMPGVMRMLVYVAWRALTSLVAGPRYCMAGIGMSLDPLRELVLDNELRPPIDRCLDLEADAVKEGIAYIATHRAKGKVVIAVGAE
ncbi:NADP-dependent oxidoreductase [Thermodesulfobacteriota bacterium]